MTFDVIRTVGPGGSNPVPPHPHDASEVSGEADFLFVNVAQLLAGTIDSKEIVVSGGTAGVVKSSGYVAGSAGWAIFGDGSAEFSDVTVRGTIEAGAGSTIGFDAVTGASNTASLVIGSGGTLESSNFVTGTSGWQIDGDGNAEFQDVTARGVITSQAGSAIDWTHLTNISVDNADINSLSFDKITAATNTASLVIGAAGTIESANYSAGTAGFHIGGDGNAEFNDVTVRGALIAGASSDIDWQYVTSVSVATADIENLAVTNAKIANSTIENAKISDLAVSKLTGGTIDTTDITVASELVLGTGGRWTTAGTGIRLEMQESASDDLTWYDGTDRLGRLRLDDDHGNSLLQGLQISVEKNIVLDPGALLGGSGQVVLVQGGSASAPALAMRTDADTGIYATSAPLIGFTTAGTARMTVGSVIDINVDIRSVPSTGFNASNTTARTVVSADQMQVVNNGSLPMSIGRADSPTGGGVIDFRRAGTQVGSIAVSAGSTAYNTSSDRRLKENIVDLDQALAVVQRLKPRSFSWKADGTRDVGFVAQEAVKIIPRSVTRPEKRGDPWQMDNSKLVPYLVGAIQELEQRLTELEKTA